MSEKNKPNQKPSGSGTGTNPPAQPSQPNQGGNTRHEVQPPAQQSDEQKKNQQPRESEQREERKKQDREKSDERRP
jgi:hypothetical protein